MAYIRQGIDERYHVEAAARAVDVLRAVAEEDGPASLSAIIARLGWSKPAVYRLVRTLEATGALRQCVGKGYVIGPAMIGLGQAALRATGLREIARPYLERLAGETGETIVLTVLDGHEVIYIDRIEADKILIPRTRIGSRLPGYCTSTGQALLAALPDEEVCERLAHCEFEQHGPNTMRSVGELLERLAEVRRLGYALNDEELAVGHRAVAAPVVDHGGRTAAAVSISVPSARHSRSDLTRFATQLLLPIVSEFSAELGSPRSWTNQSSNAAAEL